MNHPVELSSEHKKNRIQEPFTCPPYPKMYLEIRKQMNGSLVSFTVSEKLEQIFATKRLENQLFEKIFRKYFG